MVDAAGAFVQQAVEAARPQVEQPLVAGIIDSRSSARLRIIWRLSSAPKTPFKIKAKPGKSEPTPGVPLRRIRSAS